MTYKIRHRLLCRIAKGRWTPHFLRVIFDIRAMEPGPLFGEFYFLPSYDKPKELKS